MRSPATVTIFLTALCLAGLCAAQDREQHADRPAAAIQRATDAAHDASQAQMPAAGAAARNGEQPGEAAPTDSGSPQAEQSSQPPESSQPSPSDGKASTKAEQSSQTAPSDGAAPSAAPAEKSSGNKKPLDVKNTFRNVCGFCHEDYGRHAGKGPQLMNSERSDAFIVNRIKHGFPGRMPAFGSVYSDDQIHQILKFIRSLKPDEEPKNPT